MLAYIFWHHPAKETGRPAYEADLADFHTALRSAVIAGLHSSTTYRIAGLPWINAGAVAYEDWYLLAGSAALDALDVAAVTGRRRGAHEKVASAVAGGAGGLYRIRSGEPSAPGPRTAQWFSKPDGLSYAALDDTLRPSLHGGSTLWQRQMVLGPGLEFCLLGADSELLPHVIPSLLVRCVEIGASERDDGT